MFNFIKRFFAMLTKLVDVTERGVNTLDNFACDAEERSHNYLAGSRLERAKSLKDLEADLSA